MYPLLRILMSRMRGCSVGVCRRDTRFERSFENNVAESERRICIVEDYVGTTERIECLRSAFDEKFRVDLLLGCRNIMGIFVGVCARWNFLIV